MAKLSIIILTFNSSRFISDLLKSLQQFQKDSEIIVVDNASSDNTVASAKKFDWVRVVETGQNLGFAKGINFGAKKATGEYLLFINPDTEFKSGSLSDLKSIFENNEKIGIVGGKLVDKDGQVEKSAGKFFNLLNTFFIILGLDEAFGSRFSPNKFSRVDFVSGGFMIVRSDLFKKLNGFDENFFMYLEDMELCFRAKKIGFETYFAPSVVVTHAGQGSSSRGFAVINIYKGILYFYKKHKTRLEYEIVRIGLGTKAIAVYFLGRITNNSYYTQTYGKALEIIR